MVLDRDDLAPASLAGSWRARRRALAERLEGDPGNGLAWLWRIRLRVCTYMLVRHDPASRAAERLDDVEPVRSDGTALGREASEYATQLPRDRVISAAEARRREAYREHCHDVLERIAPVGKAAQTRTVEAAGVQVRAALRRREQALRVREGGARVFIFLFGVTVLVCGVRWAAHLHVFDAIEMRLAMTLVLLGSVGIGLALVAGALTPQRKEPTGPPGDADA